MAGETQTLPTLPPLEMLAISRKNLMPGVKHKSKSYEIFKLRTIQITQDASPASTKQSCTHQTPSFKANINFYRHIIQTSCRTIKIKQQNSHLSCARTKRS